jgi:hypothetical protein
MNTQLQRHDVVLLRFSWYGLWGSKSLTGLNMDRQGPEWIAVWITPGHPDSVAKPQKNCFLLVVSSA